MVNNIAQLRPAVARNNPATSWNVPKTCAATCLLSFIPSSPVSSILLGLVRAEYSGQDLCFLKIENFRFFVGKLGSKTSASFQENSKILVFSFASC